VALVPSLISVRHETERRVSEDAVLGGRLRLRQFKGGHRVGHDAILLAAACPARAGERAADLGAGVGAAGLALAARVEELKVTLVEVDERLAALAGENARANGLAGRVDVVNLDVTASSQSFAAAGLCPDSIARILMNPPFNDPTRQRASPDEGRRLAHVGSGGGLAAWVKTASRLLRPRGTLSLIWRADTLDQVLRTLVPRFGEITILPVHPKPGRAAVRVLVRATKASRAPIALLPGFVLSDDYGRPLVEAESVLRGGALLPLAELSGVG
jgi:tRNA1(Val) A37 N6-methylase TrmN6